MRILLPEEKNAYCYLFSIFRYHKKKPVLIKGLIEDWPANSAWRRQSLLNKLGDHRISTGDGANIVMSGGWSGHSLLTLGDYLHEMSNVSSKFMSGDDAVSYDLFNFDGDFLSAMPEMKDHFEVPSLFHSWAGREKRGVSDKSRNPAWSILSMGATRTGLPFHIHGEVRYKPSISVIMIVFSFICLFIFFFNI